MIKFNISKVISTSAIPTFVADLNTRTCDGHIADQTEIGQGIWLIRIECTQRDDADLVRTW